MSYDLLDHTIKEFVKGRNAGGLKDLQQGFHTSRVAWQIAITNNFNVVKDRGDQADKFANVFPSTTTRFDVVCVNDVEADLRFASLVAVVST